MNMTEHNGASIEPERESVASGTSKHIERIDMVSTAQTTQLVQDAAQRPGTLKVVAPAKVNLFLGIGSKRADGYHDAVSIMHAIALHDVLYVRRLPGTVAETLAGTQAAAAGPNDNIAVRIVCLAKEGLDFLDIPTEANIVYRAIDKLARACGYVEEDAIEICIEKHIPHEAGLGGGSSDAAAALRAVSQLWGVSDEELLRESAKELGADVAFFLEGGCACLEGTGDTFVQAMTPMKKSLVLVKPKGGVSTAAAYRAFDESPLPIDESLRSLAYAASVAEDVPLFNNLAPASESLKPELTEVRSWLEAQPGVSDVLLCGSGSATFAVVDDFATACRVSAEAGACGWWSRATMFSSVKASVVS